MRDDGFAPRDGLAAVVSCAVEEFAEIHIEVAHEGLETRDVGKCDTQVAAILIRPLLERPALRICKAWAQGLCRLQPLMGHRSHR